MYMRSRPQPLHLTQPPIWCVAALRGERMTGRSRHALPNAQQGSADVAQAPELKSAVLGDEFMMHTYKLKRCLRK